MIYVIYRIDNPSIILAVSLSEDDIIEHFNHFIHLGWTDINWRAYNNMWLFEFYDDYIHRD